MDRRDFLRIATASSLAAFVRPNLARAMENPFKPSPADGWRAFEVTTRVELDAADSKTRVWLPLPAVDEGDWIRPMGNLWQGSATRIEMERDSGSGAQMLAARWEAADPSPVVEITSRVATRNRAVDFRQRHAAVTLDPATARLYTRATKLLPTDGIVRKTAIEITRGAHTDLDKARAIYDWIIVNTVRDPQVRGCGIGDIRSMLEVGDLSRKMRRPQRTLCWTCARDWPAGAGRLRDSCGSSRFGYKSLGRSGDITRAQHCRAEVWLSGFGWVPVTADVRKVMLEERPGLTLKDDVVVAARAPALRCLGNELAGLQLGHDLTLPGSRGREYRF